MNTAYLEKLKDPRWQKIRLKILERDNWVCQKCFDPNSTLHIHHKYYLKDKEPWEYPLKALITLCEFCHKEEREVRKEIEKMLLSILRLRFFSDDLLDLCEGFESLNSPIPNHKLSTVLKFLLQDRTVLRNLSKKYLHVSC